MKRLFLVVLIISASVLAETKCKSTLYDLATPIGYNHVKYAPSPIECFYDGKSLVASVDENDDDDKSLTNGDSEEEYLVEPQWIDMHI